MAVTTGSGLDGPNSVQLAMSSSGLVLNAACTAQVAAWHAFEIDASALAPASILVAGHLDGHLVRSSGVNMQRLSVEAVLQEIEATIGEAADLDVANVMTWQGEVRTLDLARPFAAALSGDLRPGRTYRVGVRLVASYGENSNIVDFGPPGTGRGVRYDSIEVCLDDPTAGAVDTAAAARDLEEKLYRKECLPTVWLPAAQGGRLEEARALLADIIARAEASGDPGANIRVANSRLASADQDILDGAWQRACRGLADGVRALTTP